MGYWTYPEPPRGAKSGAQGAQSIPSQDGVQSAPERPVGQSPDTMLPVICPYCEHVIDRCTVRVCDRHAKPISKSELTRRALLTFETEPCPRCNGGGWYSYCDTWGRTCFECGFKPHEQGTGRRFSKRGRVAREHFLVNLPTKPASALVPGDVFVRDGAIRTVVAVRPTTSAYVRNGMAVRDLGDLDIETHKLTLAMVPGTTVFSIAPTEADVQAALASALAFQETLTKAGTIRKRPARPTPGLR